MGDYISREALKKAFDNADADVCESYSDGYCDWGFGRKNINDVIDGAPAADVAPVVHGRWEWFDEDVGTPVTGYEREWGWRCSHCGEELPDDYDDPDHSPMLRFCPNCGAKMDGGDNTER